MAARTWGARRRSRCCTTRRSSSRTSADAGARSATADRRLLDVARDARAASGSCSSAPPASSARWRCRCCCAATPTSARCSCWCGRAPASSAEERFFQQGRELADVRSAARAHGATAPRPSCARSARRSPATSARPLLQLHRTADLERIGKLDVIINCAGLVSFEPSLETALRINALGREERARRGAQDRRRGSSTSRPASSPATATARSGRTSRSSATSRASDRGDGAQSDDAARRRLLGRRRDRRLPAHHRPGQRAPTTARTSRSSATRARAPPARTKGRDPDDERTLKIAVARERKMWVAERADRPRHGARAALGLAQHLHVHQVARRAGDAPAPSDVRACDRAAGDRRERAALSVPGLERGLHHLGAAGVPRRSRATAPIPAGDKATLDVIPVDLVAVGPDHGDGGDASPGRTSSSTSSARRDVNPLYMKRAVELLGLHKRRYFSERKDKGEGNELLEPRACRAWSRCRSSRERFDKTSAPVWMRAGRRGDRAHRRADAALGRAAPRRASPSARKTRLDAGRDAGQADERAGPAVHAVHLRARHTSSAATTSARCARG